MIVMREYGGGAVSRARRAIGALLCAVRLRHEWRAIDLRDLADLFGVDVPTDLRARPRPPAASAYVKVCLSCAVLEIGTPEEEP